jgi:recombination protein RecT
MSTIAKKDAAKKTTVTVKDFLISEQEGFLNALPKHMHQNREAYMKVLLLTLHRTPALAKCRRDSLLAAISDASSLGLFLDGYSGDAYLIPYGEEATLVLGYKGLTKMARQSGEVRAIAHDVVRGGDEWQYRKMPAVLIHNPKCEFESDAEADAHYSDANILGAYAQFELTNGSIVQDYWPIQKLKAHGRKFSPAYMRGKKDCCWISNLDIACRKTVLRSLIARGLVPVSASIISMTTKEEEYERSTVEATFTAAPAKANLDDLTAKLQVEEEEAQVIESTTAATDDAATEDEESGKSTDEPTAELSADWRFLDIPKGFIKALEACKDAQGIGKAHTAWKEKIPTQIMDIAISKRLEEVSS